MKKKKKRHPQRMAPRRRQSTQHSPTLSHRHRESENIGKLGFNAAAFWISGLGAAITLIGNYSHFLTATSWIRWFVDSWSALLDHFWILFWEFIGLYPPRWLRATSSLAVFLSIYLSGINIPKRLRKSYDSTTDYFRTISVGSEKFQAKASIITNDFYIYTGLKYILIGLTLSAGMYRLNFETTIFFLSSVFIIMFIMMSPALKLWYREKLAIRMMFILFSAAFLFALSRIPFMQFDPNEVPSTVQRTE